MRRFLFKADRLVLLSLPKASFNLRFGLALEDVAEDSGPALAAGMAEEVAFGEAIA